MLKRYIGFILCICLMGGVLTGCHIPFIADSEKERTLVFSHWDVENQKVYETLAREYMKKNKGLTVKVQVVPREEYTDAWLQSISNNNMADLFAVPVDDFETFIESDNLMDLTKVLPDDYKRSIKKIGTRDGHVWAVPVTGSVPVIFYNKMVFQNLKLVPPQTISDFVVNCSVLQHNGITPFAMSRDENDIFDTADFIEGIIANGPCDTDLISDGKFFNKNKELDSGFYYDVMGLAFELTISDLMVKKGESVLDHQKLLEQFVNGTYAMFPGNSNDIQKLRELNDKLNFGYFSMPGSKGTNKGIFKADMMLGISDKSKVDSDARGFVNYLLSKDGQKIFCNGVNRIPVTDDVPVSDPDLAAAQEILNTVDGLAPSLYQRITEKERAICDEKLDLAFSDSCGDLEEFMLDWTKELKAVR